MKVKIIEGDEAVLSAVAYGKRSRDSVDRSVDRLRRFSRNLRDGVMDRIERIESSVRRYLDEDIIQVVRDVNKRRKRSYRDDVIMFLGDAESIADCTPTNRRWLLANKRLGALFRQQRIDAWGCKLDFLDFTPGERDPYYEAIHNGEVKEHEDGYFYSDYSYGDCTINGDTLLPDEQLDLIATHDVINACLDEGIDPTSPLGEKL